MYMGYGLTIKIFFPVVHNMPPKLPNEKIQYDNVYNAIIIGTPD